MLRVGSGFPGACLWSSPKLYDHGFTAGALFFPDGYSYSLPVLPHGRCDLPALIVGCIELRHIWKGVPRQGTHKRGNLLSVLYLTRYPRRGNGLAFGPWLVTARKGRKKEGAWGSHSLMLHSRIDFKVCVASWQHLKNFLSEFRSPRKIVQTDLIIVSQCYHGLDTGHAFPTFVPAHGASFKPAQLRYCSH